MKNLFKVLGIIALVAIIGFSLTACGDDGSDGGNPTTGGGSGTFTVTGIPSQHNGKYALFMGGDEDGDEYLMGFQSINMSSGVATLVRIANGSVSLPMWTVAGEQLVRYSGTSDTAVPGMIEIYASATYDFDDDAEPLDGRIFLITFSNGSASTTWNSGLPLDE